MINIYSCIYQFEVRSPGQTVNPRRNVEREEKFDSFIIIPFLVYLFSAFRFCRGCKIDCGEDKAFIGNAYIAVDWDPTALHLRYQTSQERVSTQWHPKVVVFICKICSGLTILYHFCCRQFKYSQKNIHWHSLWHFIY